MIALLLLASPIFTTLPDGRVDWTHRRAHVIGVAHPEILSPTGDRTLRPIYPQAREDALARMDRLLAAIPYDEGRLAKDAFAPQALAEEAKRAEAEEARRFSDGAQHLPLSLDFSFMTPGVEGPLDEGPSGLLIRVEAPVDPAARLTLEGEAGQRVHVGAPEDRLNGGVIWVEDIKDARAHVGRRPRKIYAEALGAPGAFKVKSKDAKDLFEPGFTFIGGVAVWIKPAKKQRKARR